MTVQELITKLEDCPPMNEVYVQTLSTALNKVEKVRIDKDLGYVELKWKQTMKLQELSIGNWVYNKHHGKAIQITPFDFFTHTHKEEKQCFAGNPNLVSGKDFEPIPITPEILEKNGWKFDGCYSNTVDSIGRMIEYYHFEGILRLYIDDKPYTTIGPGQKYIHQLQNALTLCGIEKEIEL